MYKVVILVIFISSLITATGLAFWYYNSSQREIARLNQNNSILSASVQLQNETINELTDNMSAINEQLRIINQEFSETRQQNRQLVDRLARHEIDVLARARPTLVERTINNATAQANRCFELLSGAELNEREQNARNPREANSECPWFFDNIIPR